MAKQFRLTAEQIVPLVEGLGGCFATDRITADGQPVGFMYRQEGEFKNDRGWRFLAGTESQEYLDNADNLTIYDVNTIANYDRAIIPMLDAPVGSAFERDSVSGDWVAVNYDTSD